MNHALLTRNILHTGSTAVSSACTSGYAHPVVSCAFYPLAANVSWAQAAVLTGGAVGSAMNAWAVVRRAGVPRRLGLRLRPRPGRRARSSPAPRRPRRPPSGRCTPRCSPAGSPRRPARPQRRRWPCSSRWRCAAPTPSGWGAGRHRRCRHRADPHLRRAVRRSPRRRAGPGAAGRTDAPGGPDASSRRPPPRRVTAAVALAPFLRGLLGADGEPGRRTAGCCWASRAAPGRSG